jgi:cytidylate kinase
VPIITISRGSYSGAKDVAEKVARRLGFECVSREILLEAAREFDVSEDDLLHAFRDAPSVLERFTFRKERYIAFLRAALLSHLQKDNVVYHGLAGHYFVRGVSHVLKVRIIANMEDRVQLLMRREELYQQAALALRGTPEEIPLPHREISKEKAAHLLEQIDETRRKWGQVLYGMDPNDPNLYDLVIHIHKLTTDDAADLVYVAAGLPRFQATTESQQVLENLLLAARVKASLVERHPRIKVTARAGAVSIGLEGGTSRQEEAIREAAAQIPGTRTIDINTYPFSTPD